MNDLRQIEHHFITYPRVPRPPSIPYTYMGHSDSSDTYSLNHNFQSLVQYQLLLADFIDRFVSDAARSFAVLAHALTNAEDSIDRMDIATLKLALANLEREVKDMLPGGVMQEQIDELAKALEELEEEIADLSS